MSRTGSGRTTGAADRRRGPAGAPAAARSPRRRGCPTSRTVVIPGAQEGAAAIRPGRTSGASFGGGSAPWFVGGGPNPGLRSVSLETWAWASMSPGRSVRPARSIASAGGSPRRRPDRGDPAAGVVTRTTSPPRPADRRDHRSGGRSRGGPFRSSALRHGRPGGRRRLSRSGGLRSRPADAGPGAQATDLGGAQATGPPAVQVVEADRAHPDANQALDRRADGPEHPAQLALPALREDRAIPGQVRRAAGR